MGWETLDARSRKKIARLGKMGREDDKLERAFSYFTKKIKNEKDGWKIVGDAFRDNKHTILANQITHLLNFNFCF
jgi:hypothetical protein